MSGDTNGGTAAASSADGGEKRKSRWGSKAENDGDGEGKKRSRWGDKAAPAAPAIGAGAMIPFGMPGAGGVAGAPAPSLMTPEQLKVQGRLNEIQRLMAQPK